MRLLNIALLGFVTLALGACGSTSGVSSARPDTAGSSYKIGNPYQVNGIWYYPREDYTYDETGIASWYGPGFHGKNTANGEVFDANELTAAHPTLPLPTLARVTNLDNGRSIVVRINDRGPFARSRLIDVSRRTAQLLGFESAGTAKVRVQVLSEESKAIAVAAQRYGTKPVSDPGVTTVASAPVTVVQSQQLAPLPNVPVSSAPLVTVQTIQPAEPLVPPEKISRAEVESFQPDESTMRVMPVKGNNEIYVQAGSFTVMENAAKLKTKLSSIAPVNVMDSVVNGVQFYRVRLGPIASVEQADRILQKVVKAGVAGPRVIVD